MSETCNTSIECVFVGGRRVEISRPSADSICNPDETIVPQAVAPDTLWAANEQGPCGGVEMAEAVMDHAVAFRDSHEQATGFRIGVYGNHPPSKGADRAQLYEKADVKFGVPIEQIPEGSFYFFSAHGANPAEKRKAIQAGLLVFDTTCPFVSRIYKQIQRTVRKAKQQNINPGSVGVVYFGGDDMDHPEVQGTRGVAEEAGTVFIPVASKEDASRLAKGGPSKDPESTSLNGLSRVMVTGLTTNNSAETEEIAAAFASFLQQNGAPEGFLQPYESRSVCGTVKHRQNAARAMVRYGAESLIVVGAIKSNNTNNLVQAALDELGRMEDGEAVLRNIVFANTHRDVPELHGKVGVVSGASTQQLNIDQITQRLGVARENIIRVGDTDKVDMFKPTGGAASLASLALKNEFDWYSGTA